MLLIIMMSLTGCTNPNDPAKWGSRKINEWFEKGEWLNGWSASPDLSIDRKAFAIAYFKNKDRWNAAFAFLKNNDLSKLEAKRYDLDGNNLYIIISEYNSKDENAARFEIHREYIDIQYVIAGHELIGVAPLSSRTSILEQYDAAKDIEFVSVSQERKFKASPDRFFIFFPSDAHRPGMKDGENSPVRKLVVKIKTD